MALVAGKIKNVVEENIKDVFLTPYDIPGAAVKNEENRETNCESVKILAKRSKD